MFEAKDGSMTVFETIDGVNYIYGLTPGMTQEAFITDCVTYENATVAFSGNIGTGCTVTVTAADSGTLYDTYTLIMFGDVDGDGWYDGQDATIVNCIASGMLTREKIGEAKYLAADCNHDGEVDSSDVLILEKAGLLLSDVDQSLTQDELMESDSYMEYLNLIDQNPIADETPAQEPADEPADEPAPAKLTFFERLIKVLKKFIADSICWLQRF